MQAARTCRSVPEHAHVSKDMEKCASVFTCEQGQAEACKSTHMQARTRECTQGHAIRPRKVLKAMQVLRSCSRTPGEAQRWEHPPPIPTPQELQPWDAMP